MAIEFLDKAGATYLIGKIKTLLGAKVDKVTGKGLSTEDYTTAEKTKLGTVAENANNYSLPPASSTVLGGVKIGAGLSIRPTKVSQFTNDSGFQTSSQVEAKIKTVVGTAPEALDTLKEIADSLNNDPDFAGTITTQLAGKVNTADLTAITDTEIDAMFTS